MIAASLALVALAAIGGALLHKAWHDRREHDVYPMFQPLPRRVRLLRGNRIRRRLTLPYTNNGDAEDHSHERGGGL